MLLLQISSPIRVTCLPDIHFYLLFAYGQKNSTTLSVGRSSVPFFAPTLQAIQKVTRKTPHKSGKLRLKGIAFRSDSQLKSALARAKISQSKYVRHALKLSEVEMYMRLKEYFSGHDVMIRIDFQQVCGMTRTTANSHLHRLQEKSKLLNVGRRTQPIYRPALEYYGCQLTRYRAGKSIEVLGTGFFLKE